MPAYIQVVRPSLIDALNQLKAVGFQRIVIARHLFKDLVRI